MQHYYEENVIGIKPRRNEIQELVCLDEHVTMTHGAPLNPHDYLPVV
jgi:hypothetical protein